MKYWIMKCEPEVYSIKDLARDKKTGWEGVRNYQARNFMRDDMKVGDLAFYYHSNGEPSGAAGVARITKAGTPDPHQFDKKSKYYDEKATKEKPIWITVEIEFVEEFPEIVPIERLRQEKSLAKMQLLARGNRLSILPVTAAEWETILALGRGKA